MPRTPTSEEARRMAALRKTRAGGAPRKPTPCPKCGALCAGYNIARVHCSFDAPLKRLEESGR